MQRTLKKGTPYRFSGTGFPFFKKFFGGVGAFFKKTSAYFLQYRITYQSIIAAKSSSAVDLRGRSGVMLVTVTLIPMDFMPAALIASIPA